jgi:hypothetical protein
MSMREPIGLPGGVNCLPPLPKFVRDGKAMAG